MLSFIKVPRVLFTDKYSDVSIDLRILYSFLLHQMRGVSSNGYTLTSGMRFILADMFNCRVSTINHAIAKLKKLGFIEVKRLPYNEGIKIYQGTSDRCVSVNCKNYVPYSTAFFGLHYISQTSKFVYAYLSDKVAYSEKHYNSPYLIYGNDRQALADVLGRKSGVVDTCISELKNKGFINTKKTTRGAYITINTPVEMEYHIAKFNDTVLQKIKELYNYRYNPRDMVKNSITSKSETSNIEGSRKVSVTPKSYIPSPKDIRDKFSPYVSLYPEVKASQFVKYYSDRDWKIKGSPIRHWDKVADKWIQGTYVRVPKNVMEYIHTAYANNVFPEDIRLLIKRDNTEYTAYIQKRRLSGKDIPKCAIRISTLELLKEYANIR